jgi:hypothetical protein
LLFRRRGSINYNRQLLTLRADLAEQIEPLHIWQPKIEDDDVGNLRHQLKRSLGVRRVDGLIALRAQPHAQQFADRRLIVDHQDFERRGVHAAVSS